MQTKEIVYYVMKTPHNTNPTILEQMITSQGKEQYASKRSLIDKSPDYEKIESSYAWEKRINGSCSYQYQDGCSISADVWDNETNLAIVYIGGYTTPFDIYEISNCIFYFRDMDK